MLSKKPLPPPAILLLCPQIATGGAQHILLMQAAWFHSRGWRVTAAFLYDRDDLLDTWRELHPFPIMALEAHKLDAPSGINTLLLVRGCFRLASLMLRNHYQAIETFTPHANVIGLPLAFLLGIPRRLATYHGRPNTYPRWLEVLHKWCINLGVQTSFVVVSDATGQDLIQSGIDPDRVTVIPNGINPLEPQERVNPRLLEDLNLPAHEDIVLSVGRLIPQKSHIDLVHAARTVLAERPQTIFLIVGDGPLRAQLSAEIERLNLSARVRLLGTRQDVLDLMRLSTVFALPSNSEGLPIVILEAMAAGLAVVGTQVLAGLLENNKTGVLVASGDIPALAEGLLDLLINPHKRRTIADAAKQEFLLHYTAEQMCVQYEKLLSVPTRQSSIERPKGDAA